MEDKPNKVVLSEESRPKFIVVLPPANGQAKGVEFLFDPLEVAMKLVEEGILAADGTLAITQREAVIIFRTAIGLPDMAFSDALRVFIAFEEYVVDLQKKLDWLPTLPPPTDGKQPEDSAQAEQQAEPIASASG